MFGLEKRPNWAARYRSGADNAKEKSHKKKKYMTSELEERNGKGTEREKGASPENP